MSPKQSVHIIRPEIFTAHLDPVLALSRQRLFAIGLISTTSNFLLSLWQLIIPQVYENIPAQMTIAALGLLFFFIDPVRAKNSQRLQWACTIHILVAGPGILTALFLRNQDSAMWTASMCMGVIFAYQMLDWRVASIGTMASFSAAATMQIVVRETAAPPPAETLIALLLAWMGALILAVSTASENVTKLRSTMSTLGVVAHELRTPLATAALLADSLKTGQDPKRISEMITTTINGMHRQIDSQIINAQLLDLKPGETRIGAMALVQNAIDTFPFGSAREKAAVLIETQKDFTFTGDTRLFNQVIQNILKNALHAVKKSNTPMLNGDVQVLISRDGPWGYIRVKDNGSGLDMRSRGSIFEPFYNGDNSYSNGLGLTFCKRVIDTHGGSISLESSTQKRGSTFVIKIPCS